MARQKPIVSHLTAFVKTKTTLERNTGLSCAQILILAYVHRRGKKLNDQPTMPRYTITTFLEGSTGIDSSGITKALDGLEDKGLVSRINIDPTRQGIFKGMRSGDKRRFVTLTPTGIETLENAEKLLSGKSA
jgi:DNA-binding MarR family transcriptional regulator